MHEAKTHARRVDTITIQVRRVLGLLIVALFACVCIWLPVNPNGLDDSEQAARSPPRPTLAPLALARTAPDPAISSYRPIVVLATRFRGAVVVPPVGLEPFASLTLSHVDAAALDTCCPVPRRYGLEYCNGEAGVRLIGVGGIDLFRSIHNPRSAPGGESTEVFEGSRVRSVQEAAVTRQSRDGRPLVWSVGWYDGIQDMSYLMDVTGPVAAPYAESDGSKLVEIVSEFEVLE